MNMKRSNIKGFTLLEMMVLVAMVGVITAIGLPSFKSMMVTSEVADTTNDLIVALKRARSEALKHGRDVRVCSSTDGINCSGVAGNWGEGWLVFVDLDNDTQVDEADGELIWVKEMDSNTQLTITPTVSSFDIFVDFSYTGILSNGVSGGFNICSGYATNGYPRREITISASGDAVFNKNLSVKC